MSASSPDSDSSPTSSRSPAPDAADRPSRASEPFRASGRRARETEPPSASSDQSAEEPAEASEASSPPIQGVDPTEGVDPSNGFDTCGNCGADRKGSYCHICGQRHRDGPLTFRYLGQQVVRVFFDLERGFLYTFRKMLTAPGEVARRYLDGEQRRFISPVAYYIIAITVSILVTTLLWDSMIDNALSNADRFGDVEQIDRSADMLGYDGRRAFMEDILSMFMDYQMYLNLATIFSMAAALRMYLSFRTLAEWTVVSTFSTAQGILYSAVLAPVLLYIDMPYVQGAFGIGTQVLLIGWIASAFGENRWRSAVLGVVSYGTGYIVATLFFAAVAVSAMFGINYFDIDLGLLPSGVESAGEAAPAADSVSTSDPAPAGDPASAPGEPARPGS